MTEITTYSDFPYFSTNVSQLDATRAQHLAGDNRVCLPITDPSAQMPIYANYLRVNRERVASIIADFQAMWPD